LVLLSFTLIGIGTGALYAMVAQGLVLVYRGSGVVNFAQGALVMVGAYTYYDFKAVFNQSSAVSAISAVVLTALLGALVQLLILRPMRRSSALARVIATLGILITIQAAAVLHYGDNAILTPSSLPTESITVLPGVSIGADRLIIFGIGLVLTIVLWATYRFTSFGRITAAVAQNPTTAARMGHSPDMVATINWCVGGALAGLAGVFIGPISSLEPVYLPLIVLPAMAAALVGGFSSFPLSFVAGIVIGIFESLMTHYVSTPGWAESVPFLVVIAVVMLRGRGLPLRNFVLDRLPKVGKGKIRPIPVAVVTGAGAIFMAFIASPSMATYLTITLTMAIMCLSVVVVTGYAGQISLAQYVLGGLGAFTAAKMVINFDIGFIPAVLIGTAAAMLIGGVVGIPALRSRGINLAIVSLGLAEVLFNLILNNISYSGGIDGLAVSSPTVFGWDINPLTHPGRYGFVCIVALLLVALAVSNLRRGRVGRRLLAVRSSERAAASVGVSVYGCKLYAFMLAAGIAAIGGTLFAFMQSVVLTAQFSVIDSVNILTVTVVGGVGDITGALVGATLVAGGIGTWLLTYIHLEIWLPLIGGISVLFVLRADQDGVAAMNVEAYRSLKAVLVRWRSRGKPASTSPEGADGPSGSGPSAVPLEDESVITVRVPSKRLHVTGASVRFGGVHALADVSLTVEPGTIHGLIGPNGAGKTTLVDAITGFVSLHQGNIALDEDDVGSWSPLRRSRAGLRRSFQSVELFADMSVRENISVGCDQGRKINYVTDLFWPGPVELSSSARIAVKRFRLEEALDQDIETLPFGQRRLVAIARAVASGPSVLLLDEPAAGLGDAEAAELADLIRSLASDWGIGVLLIEHNIDLVLDVCDQITVLVEGRVLVSGPPSEIRDNDDVLAAYLGEKSAAPTPAEAALT
jgi:sulfate-transporting ATPase